MDWKLLLRIASTEALIMLIIGLLVQIVVPGKVDLLFWILFVFVLTLFLYNSQINSGGKLNINRESEYYLKTSYFEELKSNISEVNIVNEIQDSKEYLGSVYINDLQIRRQKFRGLSRMSVSKLRTVKYKDEVRYELITNPYLRIFKIDNYTNFKCHNKLKLIIRNYA